MGEKLPGRDRVFDTRNDEYTFLKRRQEKCVEELRFPICNMIDVCTLNNYCSFVLTLKIDTLCISTLVIRPVYILARLFISIL